MPLEPLMRRVDFVPDNYICARVRVLPVLAICPVCTENSILIDYVTESPNVSGDDRAALLLPDPRRLTVQVEGPT